MGRKRRINKFLQFHYKKVDDKSIKIAGEISITPHFIDKSVLSRITYRKMNWEQIVDIDELFDKLRLASWFLNPLSTEALVMSRSKRFLGQSLLQMSVDDL